MQPHSSTRSPISRVGVALTLAISVALFGLDGLSEADAEQAGKRGSAARVASIRVAAETPVPSDPRAVVSDISCSADGFCVTVGNSWSEDGRPQALAKVKVGSNWIEEKLPRLSDGTDTYRLWRVTCPSRSFCAALGTTGGGDDHDYPEGRRIALTRTSSGWAQMSVPDTWRYLSGFSCASASLCAIAGGEGRNGGLWQWDGASWVQHQFDFPGFRGQWNVQNVACAALDQTCVALAYADPRGSEGTSGWTLEYDGSSWTPSAPISWSIAMGDLACASLTMCVLSEIYPYGDELAGAPPAVWDGEQWFEANPWFKKLLTGDVSCTLDCTAVLQGPNGASLLTVRGGGESGELVPTGITLSRSKGAVVGHSCSLDFCAFVDRRKVEGQRHSMVHVTDPSGTTTRPWTRPEGRPDGNIQALECPSARHCFAGGEWGEKGNDYLGEWNGRGWEYLPLPASFDIDWNNSLSNFRGVSISCVSVKWCMFGLNRSQVKSSVVIRSDGKWESVDLKKSRHMAVYDLQCLDRDLCVLVGGYTTSPFGATMQTWDGIRWRETQIRDLPPHDPTIQSVSCLTGQNCVVTGSYAYQLDRREFTAVSRAGSWHVTRQVLPGTLQEVGCMESDRCLAVARLGHQPGEASQGWTYTLRAGRWTRVKGPAGRSQSMACVAQSGCVVSNRSGVFSWNGRAWKRAATVRKQSALQSLSSTSCATLRACYYSGRADKSFTDQFLTN